MQNEACVKKVLIVAGGTGGHIFPALAFGCWLKEHGKAEYVCYFSGSRPLEAEIYASQNVQPYCLPISGSPLGSSSILQNFRRLGGLLRAFWRTGVLLRKECPDVCFLFGGYVSLAPLLWCCVLGVPVILHEQNACAGKVTRLASRLGIPIAAGWNECRGLKGSFTPVGIPVRPLKKISKPKAAAILGLGTWDGSLTVGVIGGSLGSEFLGSFIRRFVGKTQTSEKQEYLFIVLGDAPSGVSFDPQIRFVGKQWDMTPFYSLCDIVICRAGASTLAELQNYGLPALTIPWLKASEGHQEANARCFYNLTGNPLWIEREEADLTELEEVLSDLLERVTVRETDLLTKPVENKAPQALWDLRRC